MLLATCLVAIHYSMKNFILIFVIIQTSCSGINGDELTHELIGNTYQWTIYKSKNDTLQTLEMHFVNDSIFTLAFEDEDEYYAQIGNWKVTEGTLFTSLNLNAVVEENSFRVNSWDGETLKFSTSKYSHSYEAVKIEPKETNLLNDISGYWTAPLDSFPRTIPEYEETGIFLMNPEFYFGKDTFNIRTWDFHKSGRLRAIEGNIAFLILETEPYYSHNRVIILESRTSENLELRLKDFLGQWHSHQLERKTVYNVR